MRTSNLISYKGHSVGASRGLRIALMSPYTGGNLGDAAILESARANLSRLFPDARFLFIVIDCRAVSELHDVETFPLTAVPRTFYFTPSLQGKGVVCEEVASSSPVVRLKGGKARSILKAIARCVPFGLPAARRLRSLLLPFLAETAHLRQTREVVAGLDALIIAGGGQFDDEYGGPWGHPYAMYKYVSLARKSGVPVYMVSVGVCEIRHSLTRWFLRRIVRKANGVSLRDFGSGSILRASGVRGELALCPDLAFGLPFLKNQKVSKKAQSDSRCTIGISPIVFGHPGSWPTCGEELFNRYRGELEEFAASLLEAGHSIIFFVTDIADSWLAQELYEHLVSIPGNKENLRLLPLLRLSEHLTALQSMDAVVASRLHGVILSHFSGVPVLGISYHRKVRVHMEDMGQEQFCLDFKTFTASEAKRSLTELLTRRGLIVSKICQLSEIKRGALEKEFGAIGKVLALRTGPLQNLK